MSHEQLSSEQIEALLSAAVAAPSMHNTQPWRFEVNGTVIDVFLDGSRALPAEDPTGRAMRIAAGAAIFNLRCAAASMGFDSWFGLVPDAARPGPGRPHRGGTDHRAGPGPDEPVRADPPPAHQPAASPAGRAGDGRPHRSGPGRAVRGRRTHLAAQGIRCRMLALPSRSTCARSATGNARAERARWVGGERSTADGVPSCVLGSASGRSIRRPSAISARGPPTGRGHRTFFEPDAALAVLSTEQTEQWTSWWPAWRSNTCLLAATRDGLTASFLNQLLEFDDLRRRSNSITGKPGFAHMVIRFGHTTVQGTTPRRAVASFVHAAAEES